MSNPHLRQATCLLLGQICKRYQAQTNTMLRAIGLYRGQELILAALWQGDGLTPSELAERLMVQPATMSNALQAMERSGMLERRRASHDQRVVQIFLTPSSRASQAPVEAIWQAVETGAFTDFGADEIAELYRLLSKLDANLARLAEQMPAGSELPNQ